MDINFTIPEWLLGAIGAIIAVPVLLLVYAYVTFKRG